MMDNSRRSFGGANDSRRSGAESSGNIDDAEASGDVEAIYDAVALGDVKATDAWLDAGGDINATVAMKIPEGLVTGNTMLMNASNSGLKHLKHQTTEQQAAPEAPLLGKPVRIVGLEAASPRTGRSQRRRRWRGQSCR